MKDLTIIIPPHNRHPYLDRILDYYSDLDTKILIGDSSNIEYPNKNRLNSNIEYFFFKGFSFADKMYELVNKVDTKYVLIIAEDDFYIKDSISKCLDFLKSNPSYSSCQGNYTFFINQDPIIHHPGYLQSYKRDLNGNSSIERLSQLFKSYFQMFYCMHSTNTLKKLFEFAHNRIKSMYSIEILLASIALIDGKHKVLPIYYGTRERLPTSVGQTQDSFVAIATKKKHKKEYKSLIDYLSLEISKADKISKNKAETEILNIFKLYFKKNNRFYNNKFLRVLQQIFVRTFQIIVKRSNEETIQSSIYKIKNLEGFPFNGSPETVEWIEIEKMVQKYITT